MAVNEKLLTYGLRENKLWHVLDVENGLACNCYCPNNECGVPLIAKNNETNVKMPHFAHNSGADCVEAYESALHILAKEVFANSKKIRTPNFHYDYNLHNPDSFFQTGKEIEFEIVLIEETLANNKCFEIVADAIGVLKNKQVIVEFANTSFIDDYKLEKLRKIDIPCIEVDISNINLDREEIRVFLLSESPSVYWVYNRRLEEEYMKNKSAIEVENKQNKEREDTAIKTKFLESQIKREALAKEKYVKYDSDGKNRIHTMTNGAPPQCPIIMEELGELKSSQFYKIEILKRIIDGELWNGEICYNKNERSHIILGGEKVYLVPADDIQNNRTNEQKENLVILFRGLSAIKSTIKYAYKCGECMFNKEVLTFEGNSVSVCKYKC